MGSLAIHAGPLDSFLTSWLQSEQLLFLAGQLEDLSIFLSVCLSFRISLGLSVFQSVCLYSSINILNNFHCGKRESSHFSFGLFVCLSFCLPVFRHFCLPFRQPGVLGNFVLTLSWKITTSYICLSVCQSVCLFVGMHC